MLDFISWWIAIEVIGLAALPLVFFLFSGLPDRGYAFAKALGLVLTGYVLWLIGLTGLAPANRWTMALVVVLLGAAASLLLRGHRRTFTEFLRGEWRVVLTVEALFLVAFAGWAIVRSYDPAINHTEQPMDLAFLNASIRADSFPPRDPWLSGSSISYYYFGYLISGSLAKATGVPGGVSYNLALALLFALTATGAFGLVMNMVRLHRGGRGAGLGIPMAVGALGAVFVLAIGNLEGVLESIRSLGLGWEGFWDWLGIEGLAGAGAERSVFPQRAWWWWQSSRVIDGTITESPSFSFLLGDLHPHVMSLPFVLLALGLGLQALRSDEDFGPDWVKRHPVAFVTTAICLGALGFLNSWDLPTGVAVFLGLTAIQSYRAWGRWDWERFKGWGLFAVALGGLSVVLFLPFYLTLKTSASGVFPVEGIDTRYIEYVLVLGLFLFFALSFLLFRVWGLWRERLPHWGEAMVSALLVLIPFALWMIVVFTVGLVKGDTAETVVEIGSRFLRLLPLHVILAVALFSILRTVRVRGTGGPPRQSSVLFSLALLFAGFLLTLGPELFYIGDVFSFTDLKRMNTVFKFYYQAWTILAIVSAFAVYYVGARWSWRGAWRRAAGCSWGGVAVLLVVGSALFLFGAVHDKTGGFAAERTLDGLAFVEKQDRAEMKALDFLMRDASRGSVVVEAIAVDESGQPAGDYDPEYGGVSSRTGLPTLLGWAGHEYQWRGTRRSFRQRVKDVTEIYTGSDIEVTKELLVKYGVSYIYVGRLERSVYGIEDTSKFDAFMDRPFNEDGVTIYKVRPGSESSVAGQ